MPQELHVVQCFSCRMHQVDIVKKVNKWKCKLCYEKQSLKTVLFQGSGKECRLQVQKLNGLKAGAEQSFSNEIVNSECFSQSKGDLEVDLPVTQSNWSEFVDEDEDTIYDEVCTGLPSEFIPAMVPETCSNQMNSLDAIHRNFTETIEPSYHDLSSSSEIKSKRITDSSNEINVPASKVRKIEINSSTQSEWDQFLPDELSD